MVPLVTSTVLLLVPFDGPAYALVKRDGRQLAQQALGLASVRTCVENVTRLIGKLLDDSLVAGAVLDAACTSGVAKLQVRIKAE